MPVERVLRFGVIVNDRFIRENASGSKAAIAQMFGAILANYFIHLQFFKVTVDLIRRSESEVCKFKTT